MSLELCGHRVFEAGAPTDHDQAAVAAGFAAEEVLAVLDLGQGSASARRWTTDLTTEYVRLNAEYTT